ncbi:MAG TPA: PilN domain-containing protein [Rhizomicrobium sp.]|jgi:general secretion pathway protein L|nr:PilN domain-containing protein [Rhizomicrobium sp.]
MSTETLTGRIGGMRAAWRRWCGEIAAVLPAGLRRALDSGVSIVTIAPEGDTAILTRVSDGKSALIARTPFTSEGLRTALAPFRRESAVLCLPESLALRRDLSLPLAARSDLASLLDIELERQSPLDRSEVYHDWRVAREDGKQVDVVWRIVRRRAIAPALETCREAAIPLAAVIFAGDETLADGSTIPVDAGAARLLRLRRWQVRGLLLLIVVLLVAVTAGAYVRNQQAAGALAGRVEQARIAARGPQRLEGEIGAAHHRMALLLNERRKTSMTRMLAETTRLLPQGSWLTDFSYRDGQVRVRGYSNAASSLIAIFDASPLFANAEFGAPLVQAQGRGLEQFDLSFKLRGGAP